MSGKYKKSHPLNYNTSPIKQYKQCFNPQTNYGIRALESFLIYKKQITQYKAIITKVLKARNRLLDQRYKGCYYAAAPQSRYYVKSTVFAFNPLTAKAQGSRMGKGNGSVVDHYFPVKAGRVIFELINVTLQDAEECVKLLKPKIAVPIRLMPTRY